MTFNPAVPLSSDSPSIFPDQNQANMARLKKIIESDHQFNLTTAANDGYHNLIHETIQNPSGGLTSTGRLYVKTAGVVPRVHQFYMDDTGQEYQITPNLPRAAVNFDGTGPTSSVQTMRSWFNVDSVTQGSQGQYTLAFPAGVLPDDKYLALITGMGTVVTGDIFGFIQNAALVSTSQTALMLKIQFRDSAGADRQPLIGNVVIFSLT